MAKRSNGSVDVVPTAADIAAERARRSLVEFVRQAWPVVEPGVSYIHNWHIECICAHLEAVTRGDLRNLVINIPPRHMKSLLVSVFWPVWTWLTHPHTRWVFSSYAESLAVRDSLKCRRLILSPWFRSHYANAYPPSGVKQLPYANAYPPSGVKHRYGGIARGAMAPEPRWFSLAGDQNLKHRYDNDRGGYRLATSVGGSNTGEGGDAIVADDPHNVAEAESALVRQGVLTWWDEVMSTRLNDPRKGARVVVMQRLHANDLTGHLLERGGWHHLCLPARYEAGGESRGHSDCDIYPDPRRVEGELLWPSRYGEVELGGLEADLGPYAVAGQLQQRPVPREGALFHADWFRPLPLHFDAVGPDGTPSLRASLTKVAYWDLAWSEREQADYTACCTLGVDTAGNHYILGLWRERVGERHLVDALAEHVERTRPVVVGVEEGAYRQQATRDLVRQLNRRLGEMGIAVGVRAVRVDRDKVTRAQVPAGRARLGQVYGDRGAPWWDVFERELLAFPRGRNDDQVDAYSGATQLAVEWGVMREQGEGEERQKYQLGRKQEEVGWDVFGRRKVKVWRDGKLEE